MKAETEKLIEALSFRQIGVMREEYAVSSDGMKMFGVMDLSRVSKAADLPWVCATVTIRVSD